MNHQKTLPTSASLGASMKFEPPVGLDTIMKNGTIETVQTRHQCITGLGMYQDKSFEELRYEHYRLGGRANVLSTANTTTQQTIPSVLNPEVASNPAQVFPSPIIRNAIAFPNPPSTASCGNFAEAYANRLRNPSSCAFRFSNPTFNSTNATSTAGRTATHYPDVAFSTFTPSSRSTATVFDFTPAEAYANRLRNPSTFSNPTFNSTNATSTAGRTATHYPDVAFSNITPSSRSTATVFSFTPARAYANIWTNPSTAAFRFSNPTFNSTNATSTAGRTGNRYPDAFTFSNPTTESRCYQTASWNPQSNESMFSASTSRLQCTICADNERDIAFEPCGHLFVCSTCVNKIGIFCPVCRNVIKKKIKVYIS